MYELVYCSAGAPNLSQDDIMDILKISKVFNDANNISGCLVYHQDRFIQILEGKKDIVQALFERIEQDKRHQEVLLLSQGKKTDRNFPNWSMAFLELKDDVLEQFHNERVLANLSAFADLADRDSEATDVFWSFVKRIIEEQEV